MVKKYEKDVDSYNSRLEAKKKLLKEEQEHVESMMRKLEDLIKKENK